VICRSDPSRALRDRSPQTRSRRFRALHDLGTQCGQQKETIVNTSTTVTGLHGLIVNAIFGFLGLGLCDGAAADPGAESRTVKFADLDMSNPSSAHALYRRIRAAAQVVCSYHFFVTDTDKARCVRDATADAVTKINQSALSAVYSENNKTPAPSALVSKSR
jgi:UrcA family protein